MSSKERLDEFIRARGVETPCTKCRGLGVRSYSSTATWHGGLGGNMFTSDICDGCWGSGDENRKWTNLKQLKVEQHQWDQDQVLQWLAGRLGTNLPALRRRVGQLSDLCRKQANKRKLPEGEERNEFWWAHEWNALADILGKLAK